MGIPYPANLPQNFQVTGYRETGADNQIRTRMDIGPDKVRRRTSSNVRTFVGRFWLTATQYTLFRDFYEVDTLSGVIPFDYTDPHGITAEFRFLKSPIYIPNGPVNWIVSVEWEQLR